MSSISTTGTQHNEAGASLDDPSESQSSKPPKPKIILHSAAFYDSLSKVWLTHRALKELDRRTFQANNLQRSAFAPQQLYQEDTWKKQIQRFSRHGGPELCDLRGYSPSTAHDISHAMSSDNSCPAGWTQFTEPTTNSKPGNRKITPYDRGFEQHLFDHHVYMNNKKSKLQLSTELYQRLAQRRPSLSTFQFSNSAFTDFQQKNEDAIDEGDVMREILPIIAGNSDIPNKQNLLFTQLNTINDSAVATPRPDFYDGARLEDIDKRVREDLRPFIIPTNHLIAPVAPNFFLEAKGPDGGVSVVKRQACYDGALGARAMHELQSYKQDQPVYDGNAYTFTTTYHAADGVLTLYCTHPTQSADGTTQYHMTQVNGWHMTGNPESFRQGATAFRNIRDWAQEQRDGFISAANSRAKLQRFESSCE